MAREMKDSGVEWIGEIPREWGLAKVSYFYDIQLGKMLQPERNREDDTYENYLCAANVGGNHIKYEPLKQMWFSSAEKDAYEVKNGDLLVVEGGDVASCDVVAVEMNGVYLQNALHRVRAKSKDKNDIRILKYLLWLAKGRGHIDLICNKATIAHFSKDKFLSLQYPCIPLPEQRRIAAYLDTACAQIDTVLDKTCASIEEYKRLKQAVITQAVTKGIRPGREMKDSGVEWVNEIPKEWKVRRGKLLFKETNERSQTGSEELLTVSHITGITPRSQKEVNMFMAESLVDYKVCRVGDIAANTMWMWQGAIGVSKYHGVISPSYNTYCQTVKAYDAEYLDYLLRIRPLIDTYTAYSTGITLSRLRLYPEEFLSIRFIIPPLAEQQEIAAYLDEKCAAIDALIAKKTAFLSKLEAYKKSLIYEYVTGKKEVDEECLKIP